MAERAKHRPVPQISAKSQGTSPYAALVPVLKTPKARARELVGEKAPSKRYTEQNEVRVELKKRRK
jgi:hypothetical protein